MRRFKKILVYADLSAEADPGLDRAVKLARQNDAALRIVDIIAEDDKHTPVSAADRREYLEGIVAPLKRDGIDATTDLLRGRSCVEIIQEVIRHHHDLVIKTARVGDLVGYRFFGPTAIRLIRMCPCPVWIIQPIHHEPYRRIVAAVDATWDDPATTALSRTVIDSAVSLAESDGSELHVVCSWTVFAENTLALKMGSDHLANYTGTVRQHAESKLSQFLTRSRDAIPEHQVHLLRGNPEDVIAKFEAQNDVDLIVMGTVARSGIAEFFLGNTPATVLRQVDCSLLVVKRDDYVSPVAPRQETRRADTPRIKRRVKMGVDHGPPSSMRPVIHRPGAQRHNVEE